MLERLRWPQGFRSQHCGTTRHYLLRVGARKVFQCGTYRKQTSLIAGTVFQGAKLALTVWFLAIYFISQAKTGLSALALKRLLGVSYPTAWRIHHKLMQAIGRARGSLPPWRRGPGGRRRLGGEISGGTAGRGSQIKVPFLAAVSVDADGHPVTCQAQLGVGVHVQGGAGCEHQPVVVVVGKRKPRELPNFLWVNTVMGNVKTGLAGVYHAFAFGKYAERYLGAIAYRFNRCFKLDTITQCLLVVAAATGPRPEDW